MSITECLNVIKTMELEVATPSGDQADPGGRKDPSLWRQKSTNDEEQEERREGGMFRAVSMAMEGDCDNIVCGMGIKSVPLLPAIPANVGGIDAEKLSVYPIGMITPRQATLIPSGMRIMGFLKSLMPGDDVLPLMLPGEDVLSLLCFFAD